MVNGKTGFKDSPYITVFRYSKSLNFKWRLVLPASSWTQLYRIRYTFYIQIHAHAVKERCVSPPTQGKDSTFKNSGKSQGLRGCDINKKKDEENYQTERNQKDLIGNTQFNQCDKTRDINK